MLVGPDDGVRAFAGHRARAGQAIAGQNDRKPPFVHRDANLARNGIADGKSRCDLTFLLVLAHLADVMHGDIVAGELQRVGQPAGDQRVGTLPAAAVKVAAVIGRQDDRDVHALASVRSPRRIASASAGSMRPS